MRRYKKPLKAGDILKRMTRQNPLLQEGVQHRVSRVLLSALDEMSLDCMDECFLVHFKRGIMTVGVESAVTRHEMQCFHRINLLEKIKEKLPRENIYEIRFIVSERRDGLSKDEHQ